MSEKIKQTLINAIANKDYLLTEQLIKEGGNVNQLNEFSISLLQIASHKGYFEFVDLLISNEVDINYYTEGSKETALTFAASAGHTEIVKLLIQHGANINHEKSNGDSAIDIAKKFGHNDISILFGQEIDPQLFGTSGVWKMDLLASIKRDNSTYMLRSMKRKSLTNEEISKPLEIISVGIFGGGNIHKDLNNVIFQSIKTNIGYFIDYPHDEKIINPYTGTYFPLGINWMQKIGTTFEGNSPIFFVLDMGLMFLRLFDESTMHLKSKSLYKKGQEDFILIKEKKDYDYTNKSAYSQLNSLAKKKSEKDDISKMKMLLQKNIDINKQDKSGKTTLMIACKSSNDQISLFLLNNNAEVNIQDNEGFTALMFASGNGDFEIAKKLIQQGANTKIKNYRGQNAMLFTVRNMYADIIELLEYSGSDIETIEPMKISQEDIALNIFSELDKELLSREKVIELLIYALNVNAEYELDLDHYMNYMGDNFYVSFQRGRDEKFSDDIVQIHNDMIHKHLQSLKVEDSIKNKIRYKIFDLLMEKYSLGKYENSKFENAMDIKNENVYLYSIKIPRHKIKIDLYSGLLMFHIIESNNKLSFTYEKKGGKYFNDTRGAILITDNKIIEQDLQGRQRISSYVKIEDSFGLDEKKLVHNPKLLIEILNLFTKDNPIKYAAHSFEWSRYGSYNNFMKKLQEAFDDIDMNLKILSKNLHGKISSFLFDTALNDDNYWGMHKISFGWSSHELREWSQIQESEVNGKKAIYFPLPKQYQQEVSHKTLTTFDDVCNIFKNEIEIRDDDRLSSIFEELEEEILGFDFEVEYINLENITFYTDVEYFRNGVVKIFEQFKSDERKNNNNITVQAIKDIEDKYVDIIIKQIGSTANKESSVMLKEVNNGDFQDIKNYFLSLCDWSIEANFKDGNLRIDYLSIDTENTKSKSLDFEPEGFSHILRFYK